MTAAYEQMTQKPESHVLCDLLNCAATMFKLPFPMTKNNANVMLQYDELCKGGNCALACLEPEQCKCSTVRNNKKGTSAP